MNTNRLRHTALILQMIKLRCHKVSSSTTTQYGVEKLKFVPDLKVTVLFHPFFSMPCSLQELNFWALSQTSHKYLDLHGRQAVISQSRWVMGMSTENKSTT